MMVAWFKMLVVSWKVMEESKQSESGRIMGIGALRCKWCLWNEESASGDMYEEKPLLKEKTQWVKLIK